MSRLKNSDTFIKKVFIYRPAYLSIQNSVSFFELSQDTFYFSRKIYNFLRTVKGRSYPSLHKN